MMFKAIAMSLAWWALVIAAGVFFGYKAAVFGVLMSVYTAAMIAVVGREVQYAADHL